MILFRRLRDHVFFSLPDVTPFAVNRVLKQGDLMLSLYDVNQQRLVDNGGSVFIGDRLFIEIKYRLSLIRFFRVFFFIFVFLSVDDYDSDHYRIIAENCSIASSVSDNEIKLEKIQLLTNRCPSFDSRLSIRFQRLDPNHLKSTVFSINKFQTTSVVYLRCSIGICFGQIESCQEVILIHFSF